MKLIFTILITLNILFASTNFDTQIKYANLLTIKDNQATIDATNLTKGQSGIIVHKFTNGKSIILTNFAVVNSDNNSSTIKFLDENILTQDAIPTTSLKPTIGDTVVLNHLYDSSLLITPNFETMDTVKALYATHSFLNPDIFAGNLKIEQNIKPTKHDIMKFCKENNLGTIFFVIKDKLYIIDTYTFKVIHTQDINNSQIDKTSIPFFTKVDKIETGTFDFTSPVEDYNEYYSQMIVIK